MIPSAHLMIDDEFLAEFKRKTEAFWQEWPITGFQSSRGARWNPGLTDAEIQAYEQTLGVHFPNDFKHMLRVMNGTTTPDIDYSNIEPYGVRDVYAYPRDVSAIRRRIEDVQEVFGMVREVLAEQGFELEAEAGLAPIFAHRYVVCGSDPSKSEVLSIMGTDAIVYGESLRLYLPQEFLPQRARG